MSNITANGNVMQEIWGDDWCAHDECRVKSCKNCGEYRINILTDFDNLIEYVLFCGNHFSEYVRRYEEWKQLDIMTSCIIGRDQRGVRWTYHEFKTISVENLKILYNIQSMNICHRGEFYEGITRSSGFIPVENQTLLYELESDLKVREENLDLLMDYFNSAYFMTVPMNEHFKEFFDNIRTLQSNN